MEYMDMQNTGGHRCMSTALVHWIFRFVESLGSDSEHMPAVRSSSSAGFFAALT